MQLNTNELHEGMRVNNYKALCLLLGEDEKGGNARKAQIKRWEMDIDFERDGQSFIIKKIFATPKEPSVQNIKYLTHIECLLAYELSQKQGYACSYRNRTMVKSPLKKYVPCVIMVLRM